MKQANKEIKMPNVEYWYNDQVLIVAEIEEHDDSFDHQLGHERVLTYKVADMTVFSYCLGVDVDITKSIPDGLIKGLKEWVLEKWFNTGGAT